MIDSLIAKIALIGVLGIGAQWVAWRTGRPAIFLMLLVGVLAGPVLGLIDPEQDFNTLLEPIIKLAVAVILFEGGLSLNFKDLRHAGWPVLRLVFIGVPVGWALGTAAAHYGAGLSLGVSALFGGILVVTGPTVIGPMLRTLRVGHRVRDILKWEGIVNDPIGALLAVGIYAWITYTGAERDVFAIGVEVAGATFIAGLLGRGTGLRPHLAVPARAGAGISEGTHAARHRDRRLRRRGPGDARDRAGDGHRHGRGAGQSAHLLHGRAPALQGGPGGAPHLRRVRHPVGDDRLGDDERLPLGASSCLPGPAAVRRCGRSPCSPVARLLLRALARAAVHRLDRAARHRGGGDHRPVLASGCRNMASPTPTRWCRSPSPS